MAKARNMFVNTSVTTSASRPIYNPVIGLDSSTSCELALIDNKNYNLLYTIEKSYGENMLNKTYEKIPNSYEEYIVLYNEVVLIINTCSDKRMLILLKIVKDALVGAINSYAVYGENISLLYDKSNLQTTINSILSGKNEHTVATATGQIGIVKNFKLANVFNAYLVIYGMPAAGVGFDPIKINFLAQTLKSHGVEPYK